MIKGIDKSDIPECVRVIRESFMTVAHDLKLTPENAPRFTAFAVSEDRLLFQLENEHRLMKAFYADSGRIVGYCSLLIQDNSECELNNLSVLPEYRHNGIGAALVSDVCNRAKDMGCVRINIGIVEENTVLRRWYESMGFVHTGTKKYDFFPFVCGYMEKSL